MKVHRMACASAALQEQRLLAKRAMHWQPQKTLAGTAPCSRDIHQLRGGHRCYRLAAPRSTQRSRLPGLPPPLPERWLWHSHKDQTGALM